MDAKEKILIFLKTHGPSLTADISQNAGISMTFAGAYLSELINTGKVMYTKHKVGSSPLYYLPEQGEKIQILYEKLDPKDRPTFDILKSKKVLRDIGQETFTRVSLRNLKDFAIPLNVKIEDQKEIFWKWYLLKDDDAKVIIDSIINPKSKVNNPNSTVEETQNNSNNSNDKIIPKKSNESESNFQSLSDEIKKLEEKFSFQLKLQQENYKKENERVLEKNKLEIERVLKEKKQLESELIKLKSRSQFTLSHKNPEKETDPFFIIIYNFLKDKKIDILNYELIKKNNDIELNILVPSVIGKLEYFCKAKNKKRSSYSDLSQSHFKGQNLNLPVLYLTTGEITKKAIETAKKELKNFNYLKI